MAVVKHKFSVGERVMVVRGEFTEELGTVVRISEVSGYGVKLDTMPNNMHFESGELARIEDK